MTLWIKNANIVTMDKERPNAQAAVVIGGFFACVGSEKETEAYLNAHPQKELETIDCGGKFQLLNCLAEDIFLTEAQLVDHGDDTVVNTFLAVIVGITGGSVCHVF